MSTFWKTIVSCLGVAALAGSLMIAADDAKDAPKGAKKGGASSGILHPDWKSETGSYEAPMGKAGMKTDQAWSATTVGAAIDGKPVQGHTMTVTGEIIDLSCYLQLGKHGEKHKSCGQKCLTNGQPVGLLAKDGTIYTLMEEEHDPRRDSQTEFRKAASDHMSHIMEVTGTHTQVKGQHALFVSGYLKK